MVIATNMIDISLFLCEDFLDKVEDFFRQMFKQAGLPQKVVIESNEKKWSIKLTTCARRAHVPSGLRSSVAAYS